MNTRVYNKKKIEKKSKKSKKHKNTKKRGGVETRKMKRKREEREEEEKSKDNECPVCLMPYTEMDCEKVNLNCGHVLCSSCLARICRDNNNLAKCPLCRGNIKVDCDVINPIALVDSDNNNQSDNNVHVFHDYDEVDEILQNGNIEDLVVYETNNQMGTMYYRISINDANNRYLRVVGDYHGLYSDDEYNSDDEVGFGGRKKRKSMRTKKKKQGKHKTKKNKQRKK
jgi:hypothetical protein